MNYGGWEQVESAFRTHTHNCSNDLNIIILNTCLFGYTQGHYISLGML